MTQANTSKCPVIESSQDCVNTRHHACLNAMHAFGNAQREASVKLGLKKADGWRRIKQDP